MEIGKLQVLGTTNGEVVRYALMKKKIEVGHRLMMIVDTISYDFPAHFLV